MIGSLDCFKEKSVAKRIAGAVFLDSGSSIIGPGSIPISVNCWLTKKRKSEVVIVTWGWNWRILDVFNLSADCWKRLFLLMIFRNCFGYDFLESGHNRVPNPPANITGIILFITN